MASWIVGPMLVTRRNTVSPCSATPYSSDESVPTNAVVGSSSQWAPRSSERYSTRSGEPPPLIR